MILDEKIKITALSFDERGISPGEPEDSPVTYTFPQRLVDWHLAKRLICFYTSSLHYQLRLPQRYSSKINTLINRGYIHHFRHERLNLNTRKSL